MSIGPTELNYVAHFAGLHSLVRKADALKSRPGIVLGPPVPPCIPSATPYHAETGFGDRGQGSRRAFEGAEHGYS
jgi:hypothetical protein